MTTLSPRQVYAGLPYSETHQPDKAEIISLFDAYDIKIQAVNSGALAFDLLADLPSSGNADNTQAWVTEDPIAANNGVYRVLSDVWTRKDDLPYSIIPVANVGAGTANAIVGTASRALSGTAFSAIYIMEIDETNTDDVTLNIGGGVQSLLTASGNEISANGLTAGMPVMFVDDGTGYRLLSDQSGAAIQAAAEAAKNQTGLDAIATGEDRVQTGLDVIAAALSASQANVAKIEWQGAYEGAAEYDVNDAVSYNSSSYICTALSTGNLPTNALFWDLLALKGVDGAGAGDMIASTYDPNAVAGDVFAMDSMVEGATKKILSDAERQKLSGIAESADVTNAVNVKAALDGITTSVVTPADNDMILLLDVSDGGTLKHALKSNFGGGGGVSIPALFSKTDMFSPALFKDGLTVKVKTGTVVPVDGAVVTMVADTLVTLPTMVAGTDYRVVVQTDGTPIAQLYSDALPTGATIIGGFHYLTGAAATGLNSGGGWTDEILEWSMWDLNYRPACPDPRGMTRVGSAGFWVDIYFCGNSSNDDGVSRNNDPILTGTNPPKRSSDYGGNGTEVLPEMNWWDANEFVRQWGKRLPSYEEMCLAGFGTNETGGRGSHPITTGLGTTNAGASSDPNFTSKWGVIQVTGCVWIWTSTLSDWEGVATTNPHGWEAYDVTGARGKVILQNDKDLTAMLYGGSSVYTSSGSPTGVTGVAGSRCGETLETLWDNSSNIAIRGACDHMWR
ncbi:hypothetical protein [Lentilitoribacter sp. EG35]|uniref:phage major tropism determinant n=1 Tax=Lentilitoribacter sp. EG35 TaxID=3234192 RepID=UPI00345F534C